MSDDDNVINVDFLSGALVADLLRTAAPALEKTATRRGYSPDRA
jgi:hypothetical protein